MTLAGHKTAEMFLHPCSQDIPQPGLSSGGLALLKVSIQEGKQQPNPVAMLCHTSQLSPEDEDAAECWRTGAGGGAGNYTGSKTRLQPIPQKTSLGSTMQGQT